MRVLTRSMTSPLRRTWGWLDDRTGATELLHKGLYEAVPREGGWAYSLGSATLVLILLQIFTGIFLLLEYVPSVNEAWSSLEYLRTSDPFGDWVRGLHLWGAYSLILVIGLHALRTFLSASYKKPRELNWMTGVILFFLVLGLAITGAMLPWDNAAYWTTVVVTNIPHYIPGIGDGVRQLWRGGDLVGPITLTRTFAIHIWVLPFLLLAFIGGHLYLLRRHGEFGAWVNYRTETGNPGREVAERVRRGGGAPLPHPGRRARLRGSARDRGLLSQPALQGHRGLRGTGLLHLRHGTDLRGAARRGRRPGDIELRPHPGMVLPASGPILGAGPDQLHRLRDLRRRRAGHHADAPAAPARSIHRAPPADAAGGHGARLLHDRKPDLPHHARNQPALQPLTDAGSPGSHPRPRHRPHQHGAGGDRRPRAHPDRSVPDRKLHPDRLQRGDLEGDGRRASRAAGAQPDSRRRLHLRDRQHLRDLLCPLCAHRRLGPLLRRPPADLLLGLLHGGPHLHRRDRPPLRRLRQLGPPRHGHPAQHRPVVSVLPDRHRRLLHVDPDGPGDRRQRQLPDPGVQPDQPSAHHPPHRG